MWPIVLGQLNLPRNIRYHLANLVLVGIIPSQVQEAERKNLDPYLEVLIDEIIYLGGYKLYDAYRKVPFNVKVEILIYVLDYQGFGKVFSLTGTGSYRACASFNKTCYSTKLTIMQRTKLRAVAWQVEPDVVECICLHVMWLRWTAVYLSAPRNVFSSPRLD